MPRARRVATEPKRLSDAKLVELAETFRDAKARKAKAEKDAEAAQKAILAELDARKTVTVEVDDLRITKAQATRITYNPDKLIELVTPRIFRKVTNRVIDKTLLAAAVQEGIVSAATAAAVAEESKNAPYISLATATGD